LRRACNASLDIQANSTLESTKAIQGDTDTLDPEVNRETNRYLSRSLKSRVNIRQLAVVKPTDRMLSDVIGPAGLVNHILVYSDVYSLKC